MHSPRVGTRASTSNTRLEKNGYTLATELVRGRTLFEHHADRLLSPASNSKLYTSALVLDRLGPDYRITTPISASEKPDRAGKLKGNVIVSGRGDPSWNSGRERKKFWEIFDPF